MYIVKSWWEGGVILNLLNIVFKIDKVEDIMGSFCNYFYLLKCLICKLEQNHSNRVFKISLTLRFSLYEHFVKIKKGRPEYQD